MENKVNFTPRGSYMLVTSNLVKKEASTLSLGKSNTPEIKEVQEVIAIGPDVRDINVGDFVFLNMQNFVQTVKTQSTIRAGVGGMDMLKEQIVIPFFSVPGNDTVFIKINSREIEGVINNYDSLPEDIKVFKTLAEYTLEQERLDKESKKVLKNGMKYPEQNNMHSHVLLRTETGSGMIK